MAPGPTTPQPKPVDPALGKLLWRVNSDYGEAEDRTARALDLDKSTLVEAMAGAWGRTLSAERDHRAGRDASAQRRGQITRQLRHELTKVIADGND